MFFCYKQKKCSNNFLVQNVFDPYSETKITFLHNSK